MANITTDKVIELLKEGKNVQEIAKEYKITRQAIYYHLDKLNKKEKNTQSYPERPKRDYNSMIDWSIYNDGLVKRGEILMDYELFRNWDKELKMMNKNKVGGRYQYPDSFIHFLARLKCMFQIDYRTLEGIENRLVILIPHAKKSADYTTLQKRFRDLEINLKVYEKGMEQEIAGDSTGLKTSNRGEYRMNKYRGVRKKYIKLHIAVNIETRQVVSSIVTDEGTSDNKKMDDLVDEAERYGKITGASFNKGYDSRDNYWSLKQRGIKSAIKPRKTMKLEKLEEETDKIELKIKKWEQKNKSSTKLKKQLLRMEELKHYLEDADDWKLKNNYGQRWKSEGRYSVLKRIFGESVFSKEMKMIKNEVMLKVNMMNEFTAILIKANKSPLLLNFTNST